MSANVRFAWPVLVAALAFFAASAKAQPLTGAALLGALREGGYVLVMRHANAPAARPDSMSADPENATLERELDERGRSSARAMGEAMRALRIPVGTVLSSPAFRARQTAKLAGLGEPAVFPELEEGGAAMDASADAPRSVWLRGKSGETPRPGTNTIIVTHAPNIAGAFGRAVFDVAMGETLVFKPDGTGMARLVARVKIEEWPALAR